MIKRIKPEETDKYKGLLGREEAEGISGQHEVGFVSFDDEKNACGAIILSRVSGDEDIPGENLIVENYYVKPEYRKQGHFKSMLSFLEENLVHDDKRSVNGIIAQVILPEMQPYEKVFLSCGFRRINDGNIIITFPVAGLNSQVLTSKSVVSKRKVLRPLSDLSAAEKKDFYKSFNEGIFPHDLGPQKISDTLLLDHSFLLYEKDGECVGFLLSSDMPDNTLYLASMYVKHEYSMMAIVMLSALYSKVISDGKRYTSIMCALASPGAKRLSAHLLSGFKEKIKIQGIHNYLKE